MNLADFHFIRPYWLISLLPYAVLLMLTVNRRLSRGNWSAVCDEALLPYLLQDKAVSRSRWPLATGALASLFAIFALAGPTWERLPSPVFRNDSALVIVLDLSRSMDAADITPSRLSRARFKISDILNQRKDGQTALVAYAGDAFTVSPLTNDTDTIENQLPALTTDIMPVDGNNAAKALAKAESLFKQAGLQQGQILLMTDGGNSNDAISEAKSLGNYPLLILGVGTAEGAPIGLTGGFLKDEKGNLTMNKVDINQLTELSRAGNGIFQPVTSDDTDIRNLMSAINLQTRESGEKNENLMLDQWSDKGPWLLLLALPLAALSFRKGLLCFMLAVLLPIPNNSVAADLSGVWRDLWQTKDQQAQKAYDNGEYNKAADLFENPDWQAAAHYKSGAYDKALENLANNKNASSFYNRGNALAKTGKLKEALAAYNESLKLNPDDEDAKFNKDLVEKALENQQKNQQQQQDQNQQNQDDSQQLKNGDRQKENKDEGKSNPSEQNNDQQQKEEQQPAEQKPESKPEQSQQSIENQPEKNEEKADKQKEEPQAKSEPESQSEEKKKDPKDMNAQSAQPADEMSKEEQQAHEQWLKRIPDDPGGLLRRKFQYQYEQRERH